ncbi:hypothetical protein CSUI_001236 [Cystoisospora suis]|uniref:Transmembrane protein n=1 Tax=Cystoisospora suis TaxID=483139 RepID=A0A2C6LDB0_9APIC|nr:hypothetical protein CSUI_001236 [Cystoisospora suis]
MCLHTHNKKSKFRCMYTEENCSFAYNTLSCFSPSFFFHISVFFSAGLSLFLRDLSLFLSFFSLCLVNQTSALAILSHHLLLLSRRPDLKNPSWSFFLPLLSLFFSLLLLFLRFGSFLSLYFLRENESRFILVVLSLTQ